MQLPDQQAAHDVTLPTYSQASPESASSSSRKMLLSETATQEKLPPYSQIPPATASFEVRGSLVTKGLAKMPARSKSRKPEHRPVVGCPIAALPVELRQQIFMAYLRMSASDNEMWLAPFWGGTKQPDRRLRIACKIDWWLRALRALKLLHTCKAWQLELAYVFNVLETESEPEWRRAQESIRCDFVAIQEARPGLPRREHMIEHLNARAAQDELTRLQRLLRLKTECSVWHCLLLLLQPADHSLAETCVKELKHAAKMQHKGTEKNSVLCERVLRGCEQCYIYPWDNRNRPWPGEDRKS